MDWSLNSTLLLYLSTQSALYNLLTITNNRRPTRGQCLDVGYLAYPGATRDCTTNLLSSRWHALPERERERSLSGRVTRIQSAEFHPLLLRSTDWLRLIATCMQSVCIYKFYASYLQTFTDVSEIDCSQFNSHNECLETRCLPPGDPCNCLVIESGWSEVEGVAAQPLGNQLVAVTSCNRSLNARFSEIFVQPPFLFALFSFLITRTLPSYSYSVVTQPLFGQYQANCFLPFMSLSQPSASGRFI